MPQKGPRSQENPHTFYLDVANLERMKPNEVEVKTLPVKHPKTNQLDATRKHRYCLIATFVTVVIKGEKINVNIFL